MFCKHASNKILSKFWKGEKGARGKRQGLEMVRETQVKNQSLVYTPKEKKLRISEFGRH